MLIVLIIAKFLIIGILGLYIVRLIVSTVRNMDEVFSFKRNKDISVVLWVFTFVFLTLVGYQAYWQLFIQNEYFEETKKLHDPRPWIIEATTLKGKIYDRTHNEDKLFAGYQASEEGLPRRYYPLGEATSHIIGYSDVERDKSGLEKFYFERLMGWTRDTPEEEEVHTNNKYFRVQPKGNDIILTLDYELQKVAYEAFGDNKGSVVAIEPSTGAVLVLVSAPSFHPDSVSVDEAWVRIVRDEDGKRLYNRALKGRYPPGSTFKPMVACAALENGINPTWTLGRNGYLPPGVRNKRVYDFERAYNKKRGRAWNGHGVMTMERGIMKSANSYFSKLGVTVGEPALREVVERFGYNQPVMWNTSRPELQKGLVTFRSSFPAIKNNHELAWSSIGQQEVLATPLQLALTAAAIANDGLLMKPMLESRETPEVWNRVVSTETAQRVQKMMRKVVTSGTARRLNVKEFEASGKTGTAEINVPIKGPDGKWHKNIVNNALFISFAPLENPIIAIAVIAEGAGYGGSGAAPVAKAVYMKAYELGYFGNTNGTDDKSKN